MTDEGVVSCTVTQGLDYSVTEIQSPPPRGSQYPESPESIESPENPRSAASASTALREVEVNEAYTKFCRGPAASVLESYLRLFICQGQKVV